MNIDSDSDDEIRNEDILDCRNDYPVKPRKAPRWGTLGREGAGAEQGSRDEHGHRIDQVYYDVNVVESTMSYLNNIRASKPELWAAEVERDRLDALRSNIQSNLLSEARRIQAVKKEQEGYYRLLQGAHMRGLQLQNAHVRRNTMTYDVLTALRTRRENLSLLDAEILRLKTLYTNAKAVRSTTKSTKNGGKNSADANNQPGTTSVLRVTIGTGTPFSREVCLHRGQHIHTPMGVAIIQTIFPADDKVVLQLPFGLMYSPLKRVVCWGARTASTSSSEGAGGEPILDAVSDRALTLKWCGVANRLTIPSKAEQGIRAAVGPLADNAKHCLSAAATDHLASDALAHEEAAHMETGAGAEHQDVEEPDPENDNRLLFSISQGSSGGGEEMMAKYFLPCTADAADAEHNRAKLREQLAESIGPSVLDPKLIMAPPAALPYLLEQKLLSKSMDTRLCTTSLASTNPKQPGVTGSLTWDAHSDTMKRSLGERGQLIQTLESELFDIYAQISSSRRRAAKLAVETSALRMSMFTRRVRH